MARLWGCAILILHSPLVRAIDFSNPSTVTAGQAFTVTWPDPPENIEQFGIGVPNGASDDIALKDLISVDSAGQSSVILVAPSTTGNFNFGAYSLSTPIKILGMSGQILAVAGTDDHTQSFSSTSTFTNSNGATSIATGSQSTNTKPESEQVSSTPSTTPQASSESSDTSGGSNSNPSTTQPAGSLETPKRNAPDSGGGRGEATSDPTTPTSSDLSSDARSKSNSLILILAVVFGTLLAILLTILLFFLYRRHRKRKQMFDNNSEWSSYFEYSNKYQKRSSKCSSLNETSLGPYDSISQVNVPTRPKRRAFTPSTLLSAGYSGASHSSVTVRAEETGYQKHRKLDGTELEMESETAYSYSIPVLSRIQHTDAP
ncbi:hypothetical protein VKT23_007755 [Stygiomarasmius scandens]|uniref:Uncharacterized protein n=1 Tax=Marasmiellus scandens TaxID=2682957 RepID=A0ABR1JIB1_9AGAR